jgi:hypothetical protein
MCTEFIPSMMITFFLSNTSKKNKTGLSNTLNNKNHHNGLEELHKSGSKSAFTQ